MIVRISAEGQYDLDDSLHERLNDLDDAVVAAVQAGDEATFHAAFEELLRSRNRRQTRNQRTKSVRGRTLNARILDRSRPASEKQSTIRWHIFVDWQSCAIATPTGPKRQFVLRPAYRRVKHWKSA